MQTIKDIYDFIDYTEINKIFLDIDGVIFNSTEAVVKMLNRKYGTNNSGADVFSWNFHEIVPTLTNEEVEEMFNKDEFFELVQPLDGALYFLNRYRDKIIMISKCNVENFVKKRKWFDDNGFADIPIIPIPLNVSKSIIEMNSLYEYTLFIDDSTNNLTDSNADFVVQFREYNDENNDKRTWQNNWEGRVLYSWKPSTWENQHTD